MTLRSDSSVRSESQFLCFKACVWQFTFICTCSIVVHELRMKYERQQGTNKAWLDWFSFAELETNSVTLSLFSLNLFSELLSQFRFFFLRNCQFTTLNIHFFPPRLVGNMCWLEMYIKYWNHIKFFNWNHIKFWNWNHIKYDLQGQSFD